MEALLGSLLISGILSLGSAAVSGGGQPCISVGVLIFTGNGSVRPRFPTSCRERASIEHAIQQVVASDRVSAPIGGRNVYVRHTSGLVVRPTTEIGAAILTLYAYLDDSYFYRGWPDVEPMWIRNTANWSFPEPGWDKRYFAEYLAEPGFGTMQGFQARYRAAVEFENRRTLIIKKGVKRNALYWNVIMMVALEKTIPDHHFIPEWHLGQRSAWVKWMRDLKRKALSPPR